MLSDDEGLDALMMDLAQRFNVLEADFDSILEHRHLDEIAFEDATLRLSEAIERLGALAIGILADGVGNTRQ